MYDVENVRDQILGVGTTAVLISPAHPRKELVITNTSPAAEKITLSMGRIAEANAGVVLLPYAVYFANNAAGFNVYQGDIYGISDGAAGQISIFER